MGEKDKKIEQRTAFEVLLRNTITSDVRSRIDTVDPRPPDYPGQCGQSVTNMSVRSSVCDILIM